MGFCRPFTAGLAAPVQDEVFLEGENIHADRPQSGSRGREGGREGGRG
jgi:hypothetical protein